MGSSVLGVPYGAGYMWGSSVLGLPYGAGYMWGVVCYGSRILICRYGWRCDQTWSTIKYIY